MRIWGAAAMAAAAVACAGAWPGFSARAAEIDRASIIASIDARKAETSALADAVWDLAELGYQETESAALLIEALEAAGFTVETGVAGMPTAFVATYSRGSGGVIGLLAEYDALPDISQDRVTLRIERPGEPDSHACGHNLMGAGVVSAAIAVREWMAANEIDGEIRVYGTPAEEGGSGKVYMTRAGLFDDVDAMLHWHPDDENSASPTTNLANRSGRFVFTGLAAHAAGAPERGRSALDGVEAMNFMVNLMREHMPNDARVHYVITDGGGDAPNVVPDHAEVYYYVRHPDVAQLEGLWTRVVAAAEGAAMGAGVEVDVEVMHGNLALLPNDALQRRLYAHMSYVGGVQYDADEQTQAELLRATVDDPAGDMGDERRVKTYRFYQSYGSTDVGDVSWAAPTGGVRAATWPPGVTAHSWQAAAASGLSLSHDGMEVAAKTLALTAADLLADETLRTAAHEEFEDARGEGYEYQPLLGERDPPLDYRATD